jgi:tol-pal system protein YbgF
MRTTIALLCLLSLGCSALTGGGGSGDELARDVEALKQRMLDLQRRSAADEVELERLRQKVAALEAAREVAAAAPEPTARGLEEEDVEPPRRVEVIEVADLEEPLEETPVDPGGAAESGGTPAAQTEVTETAQALYDQGYSLYHQGRHVQAEETFERFLEAYSTTDLADNAQYWIGECRLGRNELQAALSAFRDTVRRYPSGNKSPDALLKVGVVMERLGDLDGARMTYAEVARRFPDSAASSRASARLQAL